MCLYSARDGLPVRYSKVVAAQVVTTDRIRDFLLSVNGIDNRIAINEQRLTVSPFRVCTIPNDYATLRIKIMQKQYI